MCSKSAFPGERKEQWCVVILHFLKDEWSERQLRPSDRWVLSYFTVASFNAHTCILKIIVVFLACPVHFTLSPSLFHTRLALSLSLCYINPSSPVACLPLTLSAHRHLLAATQDTFDCRVEPMEWLLREQKVKWTIDGIWRTILGWWLSCFIKVSYVKVLDMSLTSCIMTKMMIMFTAETVDWVNK